MNLRQLAEQDLAITLEDDENGFGWPIILTDPAKVSFNLIAQTNDISQIVDPETGTAVSGRQTAAVIRTSSLARAGAAMPIGEPDKAKRPWLVSFDDVEGTSYIFKVEYVDPDFTLGITSLLLGAWSE